MRAQSIAAKLGQYILPGSSISFWHTPVAPVYYEFPLLSDYYIDLTAKTRYVGPFDRDGIPLLDYRGRIGVQHNPCAAAQYALGWFARWRRGEIQAREPFLRISDWLRGTLTIDKAGRGRWLYLFDLDAYNIRAPWSSALAQGQGISVLLRARAASGDDQYRDSARAALSAMILPIEEGGLLRRTPDGVFLEEVVAERLTGILDGMVFAVFGLQDYAFLGGAPDVSTLLADCLRTLEDILPRYDLGYWSRADLYHDDPPMISSHFYHRLHIAQLRVMGRLTGREAFWQYADRWERQERNAVSRLRAFARKAYFKLRYY